MAEPKPGYRIIRIREDFPARVRAAFIEAGRDPQLAEYFAAQILSMGEPIHTGANDSKEQFTQ